MAQIELCLLAEAAEQELNAAVQQIAQKYNLPYWVMEPMLNKLHRVVQDGKVQEVAAARQRLVAAQEETGKETADGTEGESPEEDRV